MGLISQGPARRWRRRAWALSLAGLAILAFPLIAAAAEGSSGPFASTSAADDVTSVALSLSKAGPGDSDTTCGALPRDPGGLRLYGVTEGTGLDAYLMLTVTLGEIPAWSGATCEGFVSNPRNYGGIGNGVIYRGTLRAFPDEYSTGLEIPVSGPSSPGKVRAFRFDVSLRDAPGAQGKTAAQTFVWEAPTRGQGS